MARARAAEHQRSRSKNALIEEITHGINKFQEVLAAITDLSQEGFPYRDAAQSKAELQFRECLRRTFGERSHEFQTYRNFKIRTADKTEVTQTRTIIKDLVQTLEDRKLELQGLKPPPKIEPPQEVHVNNTARLMLVSPAIPTTVTTQGTTPMMVAAAMTTNVGPSMSLVAPTPPTQPIAPASQTSAPLLTPTPTSIPAPTLPPTPTSTSASIPTILADGDVNSGLFPASQILQHGSLPHQTGLSRANPRYWAAHPCSQS